MSSVMKVALLTKPRPNSRTLEETSHEIAVKLSPTPASLSAMTRQKVSSASPPLYNRKPYSCRFSVTITYYAIAAHVPRNASRIPRDLRPAGNFEKRPKRFVARSTT